MSTMKMPWGNMAYWDAGGPGIPLIFLEGTYCDAADWEGVLAELPRSQRTIPVDFRGHGKSDVPEREFTLRDLADDVIALIEALGIEKTVLVGHSLGGIAAMDMAARCPRVAGLVLLEGWTNNAAGNAFDGDRFYGALDGDAVEAIRRKDALTGARFDPAVWMPFGASVQACNAFPFLRTAEIPVLEVYGDMGKTESTERKLAIPDNPHIEIHWIPGAGHYLPHERPREVARLCTRAVDLASSKG